MTPDEAAVEEVKSNNSSEKSMMWAVTICICFALTCCTTLVNHSLNNEIAYKELEVGKK